MALKNYYNILGIQQTATPDEVKKAFRKLSVKFHPDKNDNDAFLMEMFKSINEANEVLSNPDKRREYDQKLVDADAVRSRSDINHAPTQSTHANQTEEKEGEEVYNLWNLYLEKKKRTDNAYRNLVRVRSYDKPHHVTAKKLLTSVLVLLLVWLFLKPSANSVTTNNAQYTWTVEQSAIVYKKPNKQSKQTYELAQGTNFTLISETNYFYKIEYSKSDGSIGKGYILKVPIQEDSVR